jgi:hypothetical protein
VSIFDIMDGKKIRNKVMSHVETSSVIKLAWSASEEYLVSADDSSRIIVKRLERPTKQKPKWAVFALFDFRTDEAVEQLLFSAHGDLLLVSCSGTAIVMGLKLKKEICRMKIPSLQGTFWLSNPLNPAFITRVDGSHERQYDWARLTPVEASISSTFNSLSLTPSHHTVHKAFMNRRNVWVLELLGDASHKREIEVLDFGRSSQSTPTATSRQRIKGLPEQIADLIGCLQDRVVFLDHDYRACTWDVEPVYTRHKRHFFLPKYLLNPTSLSLVRLNKQGTLLCPQGRDVVIIRSDLQL